MKFVKFLGVGGTATALQYAILMALVEFSITNAVIASTLGYLVSGVYNYLLNYYFTFCSSVRHHTAALRFVTVAIAGLIINGALVYLLTEKASIYYLFAQVISTGAVLLWNFFAHKHWTYKSSAGT